VFIVLLVLVYSMLHVSDVYSRNIASAAATTTSTARPVAPRSPSTDAISDFNLQLTPQLGGSEKPGLSAAELDQKTLSILEEYLHICDIQVFPRI